MSHTVNYGVLYLRIQIGNWRRQGKCGSPQNLCAGPEYPADYSLVPEMRHI